MKLRSSLRYLRKAFRAPPQVVWFRAKQLLRTYSHRYSHHQRFEKLHIKTLCQWFQAKNIDQLWQILSQRSIPCLTETLDRWDLTTDQIDSILAKAQKAMRYEVDLLGSGPIQLEAQIHWSKDYKSGFEWPRGYFADLEYNYFEEPSDVKFPWELSRLQWLIPVGQAYLITQDERYALFTRDILMQWIQQNPFAHSINWACTMEVAFRIFSWTWLFKVFAKSQAWKDEYFRTQFLKMLYLHGEFTHHYLEYSTINGNHCTADAAALVWLGLFFKTTSHAQRWTQRGWKLLEQEIERQVYPDGVDFEASSAYHRLVGELFFWPAYYRDQLGLEVSKTYRDRLHAMARFIQAYTKPNGLAPLWGDADDARVFPFGLQSINDHRYFYHLIGIWTTDPQLMADLQDSQSELFWILGPILKTWLHQPHISQPILSSEAFPEGGCFIMRSHLRNHIFIDCGPVGLAGRGGHGHNDCLSFEAFLNGVPLITDCGSYVYTGSPIERNRFRSTAYHNTPKIDHTEINSFYSPYELWTLRFEAIPKVLAWETFEEMDYFCGSHSGYSKLEQPVDLQRQIWLEHEKDLLTIQDDFKGSGIHHIQIPLHFHPDVRCISEQKNEIVLESNGVLFSLTWDSETHWDLHCEESWVSPSYGVKQSALKIIWYYQGSLPISLKCQIVSTHIDI